MFDVILRNLTTNAIKFTNAQGQVILKSKMNDDLIEISVADNGTGISLDLQRKLFKITESVTQRGTANEKGSGLGLILCADFVRVNGGKIWFKSQLKEGSTFYFTIPTHQHKHTASKHS